VRRLLLLLTALVFGCAACGDPSGTAGTRTTVTVVASNDLSCAGPGVQLPNCGVAPKAPGDRGGSLQYLVWALLVAGLTIIFTVVFRALKRTDAAKQAEVGGADWT